MPLIDSLKATSFPTHKNRSTESSNQDTLEAYDNNVVFYLEHTPPSYVKHHDALLHWIDNSLKDLQGDRVLEIGSATPRDANYIRSKGFSVQTSDGSQKFVDHLRKNGEDAILLNALTDPIPEEFNLIYANAVAPHFTAAELTGFISKAEQALKKSGRLAFSLKIGHGEEWVKEKFQNPRFIHYWQPDGIKSLLTQFNFKIIFFEINDQGDLPTHHWMNITVEKL